MDWGRTLWDNVADVEKYASEQNELLDYISGYMKDFSKFCYSHQKNIRKLNKVTLDNLTKRRKHGTDDITLTIFLEKLLQHFDTINDSYKNFYEAVSDLINNVTKNTTDSIIEEKRTFSDILKSKKTLQSLKSSAESSRKNLLIKKLERDTLNKQINLLDKNEAHKFKKMQNELKEKTKIIEKCTITFEKSRNKLKEFSSNYYQTTIYNGLNVIQSLEVSKADMVSNSLDKFLELYTSTLKSIFTTLDECTCDFSIVDVSADALNFQEKYKTNLPLPSEEKLDGCSLEDIGKLDNEVNLKVLNNGSNTTIKCNSVKEKTKTESYNDALACLESTQAALEDAIKKKDALDKMVESCSKFGGFSDSLHEQMMALMADIEKLEAQLDYYKELITKYKNIGSPDLKLERLDFSSDDDSAFKPDNVVVDCMHSSSKRDSTVEIVKNVQDVIAKAPVKGVSIESCNIQPSKSNNNENITGDESYQYTINKSSKSILYDFNATQSGELSVLEGDKVIIIQDDDGSGWTLVSKVGDKCEGFVPTDYIEK